MTLKDKKPRLVINNDKRGFFVLVGKGKKYIKVRNKVAKA